MEIKKSKAANLESKRPTLLLLGLIFSFAIVLESFEWSESNVVLKQVSNLEQEDLYEPIQEIMIVKPTPKMNRSFSQTKRADKGPVIVKEKPVEKKTKPIISPKTKLSPNPNLKFDLNAKAPETGEKEVEPIVSNEIIPFVGVEQKPEFEGGMKAMMKFIAKNVTYPAFARENDIQGKVFVSFIIDEEGNVIDVEIVKGVEKHLDKEAIRVIKKMPKWKPGKQRGIPVKVKYTLPVNYTLKG